VQDEGVGISKKDLPHVFDRFYQASNSRTKSGNNGHGLGLSLAKKIVEFHGGTISVKSKLHQGSTFTVKLPK
jgi:signal transduction histidine kinase